ncbi:MAG: hypothetical protein WCC84_16060 [Candidatus Cybelea sp.]
MAGIAAIVLLSGCSGSQSSTLSFSGSAASQSHSLADVARSGGSPKFIGFTRVPRPDRRGSQASGANLFVSDSSVNAVELLTNKKWKYVTDITNGIDGPDGNWVANGEFYVANYDGINITEYSSPTSLTYTYNSRMIDPVDVTVDRHGNVFEADYNYYGSLAGFVNEYKQGSNAVIATCSPGGGVEGVAVGKKGEVFADYNATASGDGRIVRYLHGLPDCIRGKVLPISLSFAGGMALDNHGNLLVCDQNAATVDVIPPPYTSIQKTFGSGFSIPFHITINARNTRAYVADYGTGEVYVLSYPTGSLVATLGSSNGISFAWAAVDSNNYVPHRNPPRKREGLQNPTVVSVRHGLNAKTVPQPESQRENVPPNSVVP